MQPEPSPFQPGAWQGCCQQQHLETFPQTASQESDTLTKFKCLLYAFSFKKYLGKQFLFFFYLDLSMQCFTAVTDKLPHAFSLLRKDNDVFWNMQIVGHK